jgi:integrating conjugative element protein (TIGR03761 family)
MTDIHSAPTDADRLDRAIRQAQPPGKLRGEIGLTVQSRPAQRVIVGRPLTVKKPAIVGLLGFGDRLRMIWRRASLDDPYADWWLIKVNDALDYVGIVIDDERLRLDRLIRSSRLEIAVSTSTRPYRLQLTFATPYAFRAAQLVAVFDDVACAALTAKYAGLLPRAEADRRLHRCAAAMRSLFGVSQGYHVLHLDRAAVAAGGDAARRAAALMGELPATVLSGEQVAPWHPGRSKSGSPRETGKPELSGPGA